MKTHAIVQGFAICLLLVWTSVWDVPLSDAGGPPIRLAVGQDDDRAPGRFSNAMQPVPTVWQRSTQLIPTIINGEETQMISDRIREQIHGKDLYSRWSIQRRGMGLISKDVESQEELAAKLLNEEQKFYVFGMSPEPADIKSFLDIHVSRGPFRHVETEFSSKASAIDAPWFVGDLTSKVIDELRQPITPVLGSAYKTTGSSEVVFRFPWAELYWGDVDFYSRKPRFASRPIVSVAKQRPGRFNTVELDHIAQLLSE